MNLSINKSEKLAYESLCCRTLEVELQGVLCASHGGSTPEEDDGSITGGLNPYTGGAL